MDIKEIKHAIINPEKTHSMRELGPVDISGVKDRVKELEESYWDLEDENKPNNFKEFHSTKHIVFKFVKFFVDCRSVYALPLWKDWEDSIQPILDQAVQPFGYTDGIFSRVMLAKLNPKSTITLHKDGNRAMTFPHKVHIPLETNEKCTFFVNPKTYHFKEGHAYEVNNQAQHFVDNQGDTRRVHLIFEYFSEQLLQKAIRDTIPQA